MHKNQLMKLHTKNPVYLENIHEHQEKVVEIQGWIANKRVSKNVIFLIIRDGTGFVQAVVGKEDAGEEMYETARHLTMESSVYVKGSVRKDEKQTGGHEISVENLQVYHKASEYPIGKKEHGVDFLLDHRHLWLRAMSQWAIMRIRNQIIYQIHQFFQKRGFVQTDAPIFTGNACEGTTTLFETDFFEDKAYLSQSGQLYGEALAMALNKIYTFGPTFRAEKSKTRRHLSEFWMIEPEMAFHDLEMTMELMEDFTREVVLNTVKNCKYELEQLNRDTSLLENVEKPFSKVSYTDAVKILRGEQKVNGRTSLELLDAEESEIKNEIKNLEQEAEEIQKELEQSGLKKGKRNYKEDQLRRRKVSIKNKQERLKNIPVWRDSAENFQHGDDFGGSDETILTMLFGVPVMIYNWPKEIKAFYMKEVDDDPSLVKGVDLLAPEGYGEIVGGAERETSEEKLLESIERHQLPKEEFEWYLDLRRYGTVPHSGFGLGLERFVGWICGITHIRETIPFPRLMGRLFP